MKRIKLNSIKSKLIIVSVLLLTVPLIVLGVFSYQNSANSLNDLGSTNLKNSVELTIELIDTMNEEVEKGNLSLEEAQEKVKVAILGEMNEDGTRPINPNIDLGENGYLFVLDQEGNQIVHPHTEGQNIWDAEDENGSKFAQEMIEVGNNGGDFIEYDWPLPDNENQIEPKISYSKTDQNWDWVVNGSTYMMDFNQPATNILNIIFIVIGTTLVIGIIIIWLFANRIAQPINRVSKHMDYLANGDLTQEEIKVKSKDETGQLANALNNMQNKLRGIIANVSNASEKVSSQSEELTQSSNEVKSGSEQIATTMQELASGAETQANSSSDLSSMMGSFNTKVGEMDENGKQIEQASSEVMGMTKDGSELMQASSKQMAKIDEIVQSAVQKVEGLDKQSQEISKLVNVIHDIAEQTNLLALNAAIEAARAGDHGKGFAVVADEVRKLAEQVSDSVNDITSIVSTIQNESSVVVDSLQDSYKEVELGTEQIEHSTKTFTGINHAITEMATNIKEVSNNLSAITNDSNKMSASIEDIASISQEAAAGIEQTSASSQQTNSSMEEVSSSSSELAHLAEELNGLVREFKI
ncbi:methyl-accepting chemotaxis protein [Oceanobacillus halotolerans]|uniref:methyl-accepting chemotaxis protein n=1 Tax=Oceanobacillus halotolerans TaxID=2663380 RepID=UPI0013D983C8|nr:methyl-accepting chemotaxis protein [Oceanobacillus halotolerans]